MVMAGANGYDAGCKSVVGRLLCACVLVLAWHAILI